MSRITPISPSHALVRTPRRPEPRFERVSAPRAVPRTSARRPATAPRSALGDAAAEAAFAVHCLANGGPRGLRADQGVRRLWSDAYARAAAPTPSAAVDVARI